LSVFTRYQGLAYYYWTAQCGLSAKMQPIVIDVPGLVCLACVCVCLSDTTMICAKMVIKRLFGVWTLVGPRNRVFGGRGSLGGMFWPSENYREYPA